MMHNKALCATLLLAVAAAAAHAQRCGRFHDCPRNLCCNIYGYCGLGEEYCGRGKCNHGACHGGTHCSGRPCHNNYCCSKDSQCGLGVEYCGDGCQGGPCLANVMCGHLAGGKKCATNLCCSRFGYCGMGSEFCGEGCQSGACHAASGTGDRPALPAPTPSSPAPAPRSSGDGGVCAAKNLYYRHLSEEDEGCIQRVDDETPVPGSCLCYDMCAHKGGDTAGLTDAQSQTCFVDCVLSGGGWVFSPGGGEEGCAADDPAAPPASLPTGLLLSKYVRLAVTRPKVSRSREEKDETEEVLLIEVDFEPSPRWEAIFFVYLNSAEGEVPDQKDPRYLPYFEASQGRAVRKFPIGAKLEAMGADGHKMLAVSLVAYYPQDMNRPYWFETNMIFIRTVAIVYEPKE
ncbi:hypothetical protein QYE76_038022 [Lolium multiflorum]|uniref:Chitin-binding type-1 domain-containing protein n=1 Tax=Lolium multiflorum TaxID=4521 RepID=A0AAD8T8F7_LOLMU|nr:hypothetical protein QYE76_038020 [Lolium multiflorum]KAK1677174.1 hypothetical protein QYE76_038022 [Lolium multiflorum]